MGVKKGISLRMMLSAIVTFVILIGLAMYHANFLLGRSLLFAFPGWETTYHGAWPQPFGGVSASDVTLIPPMGRQAGTFHFDHVSLDVPFWEYYRSVFSRKQSAMVEPIDNLHFEFTGGHGDLFMALTGETALFGNLSAAPFEAEGCADDNVWVTSDLKAMGLSPGNVTLMLDYHSEPQRFVKRQKLTAPGLGSMALRREILQQGSEPMLSLYVPQSAALAADEWHLVDDGFVAARNRFCARKDGIDVDTFVQRHIRSVERLLAIAGVAPTAAMENAYRDYARGGGSLDLIVHYQPPISAALYNADTLAAWLPYMRGELTVNGSTQPLALVAIEAQPWPQWAAELTTFELIQREGGAQSGAAQTAQVAIRPAEHTSAPVAAASAPGAPAAANAPAAAAPTAVPGGSSPRATLTASATPSETPSNAPAPAAAVDDGIISEYRQLAEHAGEYVTVYVHGDSPVRVKIASVAKNGEVTVRRVFSSGYFEYTLDRDTFERAEQ